MSTNKMKQTKKLLILRGEGANSHVLVGEISHPDTDQLSEIHVGAGGLLTHVDPQERPAEHHAIPVEEGTWLVGRQVEYSPFDNSVTNVFD
jgi:hypothetical protein